MTVLFETPKIVTIEQNNFKCITTPSPGFFFRSSSLPYLTFKIFQIIEIQRSTNPPSPLFTHLHTHTTNANVNKTNAIKTVDTKG